MQELLEQLKELFTENKKHVLTSLILVLFFLIAAITVAFQGSASERKITFQAEDEYFTPEHDLFLPEGPSVPKGYSISHETKDHWEKSDAEQYFSMPDGKILDDLKKANEKLINDIVGSAP